MKRLLFLLLLTLCLFDIKGQAKRKDTYRLDIDTLSSKNDSVFAKLLDYRNDTLTHETTAFLFLDSSMQRRSFFYGLIYAPFKRKSYHTRVLKHGNSIEYLSDGYKKITNYKYNVLATTAYYNEHNIEITRDDFERLHPTFSLICATPTGEEWIIFGTKKKRHK